MTQKSYSGHLKKMTTRHAADNNPGNDTLNPSVHYQLQLDGHDIPMNDLIGKSLVLTHNGHIECSHCGRKTKKSFSQGYCYPCFKKLAQCDSCMMSPERCHYDAGTCREPDWANDFCMTDHIVYLANSSGIKVGITRLNQVPTRWMDQGALQALPIFRVATRQQSGFVEDVFREYVSDRTNWRAMLKGEVDLLDLESIRDDLLNKTQAAIKTLQNRFGLQSIQPIADGEAYDFCYPVNEYPTKIKTHNLDKTPEIQGVLQGIKGQYLLLDTGVINIRKFSSYHIDLHISDTAE